MLALTHSLEDIQRTAETFKRNGIDLLCLNGGDGTNHCTLTAFIQIYGDTPLPRIAFLRGGTMNTTAWDCGLRTGSPPQLLKRLIDHERTGQPLVITERNIMRVGDTYGFLFGNGLISNFLEIYYEGGNASFAKAITTLARGVASGVVQGPLIRRIFQKAEAEVRVDGQLWPFHQWDALAAGGIGHIGLGFYPFYKAVQNPGTIHLLGVACGAMRTIRQLPNFFFARQNTEPRILDAVAKRIELHSEQSFTYTVDGDLHTSQGQLVLEAGPRLTIVHC